MAETPLEYDKVIWQVFAVGVISSVTILYNVIKLESEIPKSFELLSLLLGFGILLYSSFLVLGYGYKKGRLIHIITHQRASRENTLGDEIRTSRDLSNNLSVGIYTRTRYMAELILLLLVIIYVFSFELTERWIPILMLLFFTVISITTNITE